MIVVTTLVLCIVMMADVLVALLRFYPLIQVGFCVASFVCPLPKTFRRETDAHFRPWRRHLRVIIYENNIFYRFARAAGRGSATCRRRREHRRPLVWRARSGSVTSARVPDVAVSRSIVINRRFSAAVISPVSARSDALTCNKVAAMAVRPSVRFYRTQLLFFCPPKSPRTLIVFRSVDRFLTIFLRSPPPLSLIAFHRSSYRAGMFLAFDTARAHFRRRQQPVKSRPYTNL